MTRFEELDELHLDISRPLVEVGDDGKTWLIPVPDLGFSRASAKRSCGVFVIESLVPPVNFKAVHGG
ncbi:hypothetical protein MAPG_05774 [Magnaporthiopsis poae ATCC 64411]|uniref:Uncharacterized protein n=1 Tax=Magnaporthiopsis poae (strain ATCC 64411 / 73-15) TaxID=644358 RepID=A0A0C4E0A5_MAGP6|nr:hypothetical protein MAPG_05774 [Magnaporthiopsis poae ATCC 64411]